MAYSTSDLIFKLVLGLDFPIDDIQGKVNNLDHVLVLVIYLSWVDFYLHVSLILLWTLVSILLENFY